MSSIAEDALEQGREETPLLSVVDLNYTVTDKAQTKTIVQNVSCSLKRGEMLCITGPSGSGKTSMLDIISSRLIGKGKQSVVQGKVLINGVELTPSEFLQITGVVTQEDVFNALLTTRESLIFGAKLRLAPAGLKARVDEVIKLLQLDSCASTRVGDASRPDLRGISGGEKRRLAIAMEILSTQKSLLLLDEPTSGLDAAAALNITNILRDLANKGLTVVATLHQPRASILSQFEQLLVLARGRRIYYGPISEYLPYLTGYLKCNFLEGAGSQSNSDLTNSKILLGSTIDMLLDYLNPAVREASQAAGAMMLHIGALQGGASSKSTDAVDSLAELFGASTLCKEMDARLRSEKEFHQAPSLKAEYRIGWISQLCTLLMRFNLTKFRDPMVFATEVGYALFMGLIMGCIYFQVYDRPMEFALVDTQMAITWTLVLQIFLAFDVVLVFPQERTIYLRERKAKLYSSSCFFVARSLADLPVNIFASGLLSALTYAMFGLKMNFGIWVLFGILTASSGTALMILSGALCKGFEEANIVSMVILLLVVMVNSTFVRAVPSWMQWLEEGSVASKAVGICLYYEFKDRLAADTTGYFNFLTMKSESDVMGGVWVIVGTIVVSRFFTYLAVKFLYTGTTFSANLWT